VLQSKKEVVMVIKQIPVKCHQCSPLLMVEEQRPAGALCGSNMLSHSLDALGLYQYQTSIDGLGLGNESFLRKWSSLQLQQH
jgi:hypothetical protein